MKNGVKEMTLLPADEQPTPSMPVTAQTLARLEDQTGMMPMIERLAALKDFDVEKLKSLLDMQERVLDRQAEAAFNAAFAEMQAEIPEIDEKGRITVDGSLRSRYAKNEDIQKVLKPILKTHGFSLAFKTEWPDPKTVKVVGILTHREGHARQSEFLSGADKTGSKNDIQAWGSSVSYGRRYTTCDLLNITSRGQDDDGRHSEKPEPPDGLNKYWKQLSVAADKGTPALEAVWACSQEEPYLSYRKYIMQHGKSEMDALRYKAKGVKA